MVGTNCTSRLFSGSGSGAPTRAPGTSVSWRELPCRDSGSPTWPAEAGVEWGGGGEEEVEGHGVM